MTSNWLFNALYESNEPHCVWGAVLCLSLELFSFVLVFRCRQLLYSNISQGLGKKGERLLKILPQVGNVSWSPIFLILWKLSKFELPLFLFLLSGTPVLDAFPCSLPVTFCMTASNMKTPSVQLPLPSFQKLMKCVSHPCREDLSLIRDWRRWNTVGSAVVFLPLVRYVAFLYWSSSRMHFQRRTPLSLLQEGRIALSGMNKPRVVRIESRQWLHWQGQVLQRLSQESTAGSDSNKSYW